MLDEPGRDDPSTLRAERENHLGHAEIEQLLRLGAADERLGLLVVQLQDLDVAENVADVLVRVQRPDRRGADESLEIDEESTSVRGERGEGVRGKVGACEGADVDPDRVTGGSDRLGGSPRITHRGLPHDPLLAFVVEAVCGRRGRFVPARRKPEGLERWNELGAMLAAARRLDVRVGAEARERPCRVEDPSSWSRGCAGDHIARDVSECRDRAHAGAAPAGTRRATTATTVAIAKETRKLGTVAPMLQSGGFSLPTRSTHHDGPVGKSHW